MNKKKDIDPTNSNGNAHGYQEWYECNKLWIRVIMKHGEEIGYEENHGIYNHGISTIFYIK